MADNRLAYGLAKKHGIKTDGMTPKEVWDALKKAGISGVQNEKKSGSTNGTSAKSGSIRPGENEEPDEEKLASSYDMNALTAEIEANPQNASRILRQAIADGRVNTRVHKGHQDKHIQGTQNYKQEIANGREPSILTADAKELINKHAGKGILQITRNNKWTQKELFRDENYIGIYKNKRYASNHKTHRGQIHYSNKGVHIVPEQERKYNEN